MIPDSDYPEPGKGYYQSFAKRDLYSELISVSTPNLQKHWYFSDFYPITPLAMNIKKPTH